jgi:hypothetical protein
VGGFADGGRGQGAALLRQAWGRGWEGRQARLVQGQAAARARANRPSAAMPGCHAATQRLGTAASSWVPPAHADPSPQ